MLVAADEIERLREAMERIMEWSEAYPETVFVPPTSEQFKAAHEALKSIGMSLDKFSVDAMRHVVTGVGGIAKEVLKGGPR